MKFIIPYIVFMLNYMASEPLPTPVSSMNEIQWCEQDKLEWQDFDGQPSDFSPFSAVSATYIEESHGCSEAGEFHFSVKAVFVKDKSWSVDKVCNDLLQHEQVHFDLTEYYARKMRFKFESLKNPCSLPTEDILEMVNEVYEDMETAHRVYDEFTVHGLNKENQKLWNKYVAESLMDLNHFKVVHPNSICPTPIVPIDVNTEGHEQHHH